MSSSSSKGEIIPLPKEVIDRIAAGEVVQRPASVVKELLENSIDANSTTIEVLCQSGGLSLLNVTDDGDGIQKKDLALACTRFATSKIKHYTDLKKIQTFGFRGEALASASMVSRLTIVSRVRKSKSSSSSSSVCAYKQTYKDGKPISNKPQPSPGNPGTSVKVHDLFYNVPNRKRAFLGAKKEAEEYNKILYITQRYAIHYAGSGISFVCRKKGSSTGGSTISSTSSSSTDLNTQCIPRIRKISQETRNKITEEATAPVANPGDDDNEEENQKRIEACKDVICHIFGKNTSNELIPLEGSSGDILESIKASQQHATIVDNDSIVSNKWFAYSVRGLISHSSYVPPKSASTFILFVNDRLVDFSALKRAVESLYDMLPKGKKPFVYLSLTVPGWHLDVNVHPTKREVAFLFEDLIIENIVQDVRKSLGGAQGSKTFYAKSLVLENTKPVNVTTTTTNTTTSTRQKVQLTLPSQTQDDDIVEFEDSDNDETKQNNNRDNSTPNRKKRASIGSVPPSSSSSRKKPLDPKRFVRVNSAAPEGALEPFLVSTTSKKTSNNNDTEKTPTTEQENSSIMREQHDPSCEFYGRNGNPIDLTRPGAFTSIICRCQINKPTRILGGKSITPNKQIMKKSSTQTQQPQFKVIPTDCPLTSVQTLRQNIVTNCHSDIATKLRESLFVGCVSRDLSLIQWGTELIMINHYNLAKYLFYQLALARFSGAPMAKLGGANDNSGIDVTIAIEAALQLDNDDYSNFNDDERKNKTLTHNIAEEAVKCLSEKKEMLLEYFSIKFECDTKKKKNRLLLTGLPILLEGHQPQPHALPLFLLRLATEVNYRDETQCFHDVCMELGSFYREIPFDFSPSDANNDSNTGREEEQNDTSSVKIMDVDSTAETFIKHTLFPALSYILVPSNESASDGTVIRLALLSSLYKVFERC